MTGQSSPPAAPAFVDLSVLLASASDEALLADPALAALIVEYACWERELAEWHSRTLPQRHKGFNDWIGEGRALFDRRDEVKATAYALLRRE